MKITSIQAPNADLYCEQIARYISARLNLKAHFETGVPWQDREQMIDSGEAEIGWICGLPYIWKADRADPSIELLAAAVMKGERYGRKPVYFSDVVVRRDSPFNTFDDLRGAQWAYNEPNSHSGYNVVRCHLATLGELSGFFGDVVESGAHQRSLEMVLDGNVDAAAIDSTVLEMEMVLQPQIQDEIRPVEVLGPSPIPPWVVSRSLSSERRQDFRNAFINMHEDLDGKAILDQALVYRFVPVTDKMYDPIREMERIAQTVKKL